MAIGKRTLVFVAALIVAVTRVRPISDPDYHWHLATGRWIVAHRAVPSLDPFSHTAFGLRWKFVDWLADVGMFLLHRLGGDAAVQLAFALAGATAVGLAGERAARLVPRASGATTFGALMLAAVVVAFRTTPRPQTLGFVFLALLLLLLDRARSSPQARRTLLAVPALLALWQNVHSTALLGTLAVFAYALDALLDRRDARVWLGASVASAAALLCAVRPIDRLAAGFDHLGDARVSELIPEWGSPFRGGVFGAWVVAALALLVLAAPAARRLSFGPAATAAGLSLLGLLSARMLPFAAIALLPLALETLASLEARARAVFVAAPLIVAGGLGLVTHHARPGFGLLAGSFPERAVAFVQEHHLEGKLFNDFHFGGYLIWTLGERAPVFVDGRSMALYGIEFVRDAVTATDRRLVELLDRFEPTLVVIPPDKRMGFLQHKPGWALVYFDDVAAVLVRETGQPQPLAYRSLYPGSWFEIDRLREPGRLARGRTEIERALREAPDSSLTHVLSIAVALGAGERARVEALLVEAERRFPDVQRVARARMVACIEAEDRACACVAAGRIQRDWPNNTYAAPILGALACR